MGDISGGTVAGLIIGLLVILIVLVTIAKAVRIVPQARAGIVERLGRYNRTLVPGLVRRGEHEAAGQQEEVGREVGDGLHPSVDGRGRPGEARGQNRAEQHGPEDDPVRCRAGR